MLSDTIGRVHVEQDVKGSPRAPSRSWGATGAICFAVAVLAGCGRSWRDGERSPGIGALVPAAVTPSPTAVPSPEPSATPTPLLAATVNGRPVLLSEFQQELELARGELEALGEAPGGEAGEAWLRQLVLDRMIEALLLQQAAEERGLVPSAGEVEAQVRADILAGGGELAFSDWLAGVGQTGEEYRSAVRWSMTLQRLALAVTADLAVNPDGTEAQQRAEAFRLWLAGQRGEAAVESWVGE